MSDSAAISTPLAPRARPRPASSKRSDWRFKWLLVAPAALLILAISIYPLLFSLWVLFVNYDFQIPGHAFVGLKNFRQIIADPVSIPSIGLTVGLTSNTNWSVSSNQSFVSIVGTPSGTGNATVAYNVAANGGAARSATWTRGGW